MQYFLHASESGKTPVFVSTLREAVKTVVDMNNLLKENTWRMTIGSYLEDDPRRRFPKILFKTMRGEKWQINIATRSRNIFFADFCYTTDDINQLYQWMFSKEYADNMTKTGVVLKRVFVNGADKIRSLYFALPEKRELNWEKEGF